MKLFHSEYFPIIKDPILMISPDPSISSKSQESTNAEEENKKRIAMGTNGIVVMFDHITQRVRLPEIIYYISMLFVILQSLQTSQWLQHSDIWFPTETSPYQAFINYYFSISNFCNYVFYGESILYTFIALTVIFIITLGIIIIQLLYFKNKRRFYIPSLYPTRVFLELVPSILIQPLFIISGNSFLLCFSLVSDTSFYAILLILSLIEGTFFMFLFLCSNILIGISVYLPVSPLSSFDLFPYLLFVSTSPVFNLASYISFHYPDWTIYPVILIHMIWSVYLIYLFSFRPFLSYFTNSMFLGTITAAFTFDIARIVTSYLHDVSQRYMLLILFVFGVVSYIFGFVFFYLQEMFADKIVGIKKIKKKKDFQFTPYIDKIEKDDLMAELRLDKSERRALFYLEYFIRNNYLPMLDGTLHTYLMEKYHSNKFVIICMKTMAFFPSWSKLLNKVTAQFSTKRDLTYASRFFLFQIKKVNTMRQSSTTNSTSDIIRNLRQYSNEAVILLKGFWEVETISIHYIKNLSSMLNKAKSQWEEARSDFNNNVQFHELYSEFLLEGPTDFAAAIREKHKQDMIDSGYNFNVDICYRQFIRSFNNYLKFEIMDIKGDFKQINGKRKGSSISGGDSNKLNASSSESSSDMDMAMEETIGRTLMTQARIRLALQKVTNDLKANSTNIYIISAILIIISGIIISFGAFFNYRNTFENTKNVLDRIELINECRLKIYSSALALLLHWGDKTGSLDKAKFLVFYSSLESGISPYFDQNLSWDEQGATFCHDAQNGFNKIIEELATMSYKGVDVYNYAAIMFEDTATMAFCDHEKYIMEHQSNLKSVISYLLLLQNMMMGMVNHQIWYKSHLNFCTYMATMKKLYQYMSDLCSEIEISSDSILASTEKETNIVIITFPVAFFVFALFFTFLSICLYVKEAKTFLKLLHALPLDVKQHAALRIGKKSIDKGDEHVKHATHIKNVHNISIFYWIGLVLILFIYSGIFALQIYNLKKTNRKYQAMNSWLSNARIRKSLVVEIAFWTYQTIFMLNPYVKNTTYFTIRETSKIVIDNVNKLALVTSALLDGDTEFGSTVGIDEEIDHLTFEEKCEANVSEYGFHENYRCASIQTMLTYFTNHIRERLLNVEQYNGVVFSDEVVQLLHMVSSHLVPDLITIDQKFDHFAANLNIDFQNNHTLFLLGELFAIFLFSTIFMFYFRMLNQCYQLILVLLRQISPISIVAQENLVNYLLNWNKTSNNSVMSIGQGIIHNSNDGVICLDINGIIEIVNPAITKMLGFSPEQLLGQNLETILPSNTKDELVNQLILMKNNQSSLTYEGHTDCVTDDENALSCAITILGITSNDNQISSFVVILRDETDLLEQQNEAEQAKQSSERLLYQILPRDIVFRLNQGEKDISFSVPSASIMFIDIVKFSDYAAGLSPQEIMGNLSLIFAGFDETIKGYDSLIKIKLIGDVYMCAGGLFTPDDPPVVHAEQIVKFGLDALQILEETNVKLNAVLNVRIGVNTGGPLIAGVLGTDKPTFDIIGDPINIAARLQSTDIPGNIQISQETYDLISELDFHIESRGEVFLKGKGNSPAYLVSPSNTNMSLQ
ncbi:Adenylate and Guanylate cyclase catalytic domain containing protein [Tritrichomonas foetus]|uniref:Adenylate and Guanylate cyclase catalytic domain containing protein n=1 Tax=Tritrichomonas foetus TaxID=1144522 RepID=A0A1J4JVL8_9EUKA|nr:Adenylate and Guanylate cyclase catalytic domain containing protein [Tritrichomonas foetus]|eukprot:OHT02746.1 Adenylate and Guanylate cyclase catalytic domain containing protein [Tritrichomonas foetus]